MTPCFPHLKEAKDVTGRVQLRLLYFSEPDWVLKCCGRSVWNRSLRTNLLAKLLDAFKQKTHL
jgi:hypothetical protein